MKMVIIGGTGLIGTQLIPLLRDAGHDPIAASPSRGVNTVTGVGVAETLAGADVVVDVSNSPSFEDADVMAFFDASTRNLITAASVAGVRHFVALSVVGTDRLPASGYFRAKHAQEALIRSSGIPYTIVRATQFFEFVEAIAAAATAGDVVRPSSVLMQPIAAADVAAEVARAALAEPSNQIIEIAGPEPIRMDALVQQMLSTKQDSRSVVTDPNAGYFGSPVDDRSLTPQGSVRLGPTRFAEWLSGTGTK